jgi:hypothetical protein
VPLSAAEFEQFILPHLALPKRGPHCRLGYHKPFHSILKVLYTGMQWKALPIDKNPAGRPEIHYPGIFKLFARIFYSDNHLAGSTIERYSLGGTYLPKLSAQ